MGDITHDTPAKDHDETIGKQSVDAAPVPKNPLAKSLTVARNQPVRTTAGSAEVFSIEVVNETSEPLQLSGHVLVDHPASNGADAFSVRQVTPNPVMPGRAAMVILRYAPSRAGSNSATLELRIAGRSELTHVALTGQAQEQRGQKKQPEESSNGARREKEPIPVDLVEIGDTRDQKDMTYGELVTHWATLVEATMNNFDHALQNFETVARSPSSKETVEENAASLVWGEISKHFADHVISYMLKPLPFGSELGEFLAFAAWADAVKGEQNRARQAGEDHTLMKFIVATRKWLATSKTAFFNKKTPLISKSGRLHSQKNDVEQALDRNDIMVANERASKHVTSGAGTIGGQFQRLVCDWTNHTKAPSSKEDAHIRLIYDQNWNLLSVKLEAIHGERLAEQLLTDGGVDLQTMKIRRIVEWRPLLKSGAKKAPLEHVVLHFETVIDENGTRTATRWSQLAERHKPEFEAKMETLRLPVVTEMKGSSSKR